MQEIARDVAVIPMMIANSYLVGNQRSWVAVDAGTPGHEKKIIEAAEARFGPGSRPQAIVLTHGHFDHSGSAPALADHWGVRVYAHLLERPYLTGRSEYPPFDPTTPGFFSAVSRLMPSKTINLGDRFTAFEDAPVPPGMDDWELLRTPGHTPGHVSFLRRSDGVLLVGDAFTTMDLETFTGTVTKRRQISRPPLYATTDWAQAGASIRLLADLNPRVVAAGHGKPMREAGGELREFARNFQPPSHGRYVPEPAEADEHGILYLPPKPADPVPAIAASVAAGVLVGAAAVAVARHRSRAAIEA